MGCSQRCGLFCISQIHGGSICLHCCFKRFLWTCEIDERKLLPLLTCPVLYYIFKFKYAVGIKLIYTMSRKCSDIYSTLKGICIDTKSYSEDSDNDSDSIDW